MATNRGAPRRANRDEDTRYCNVASDQTSLPRIPPPDGQSLNDYAGYEKWTNRQWAWEFLRRNQNFREACNNLPIDPDAYRKASREIAREFHLRTFKHCDEVFGQKKERASFNPVMMWWKIPEERATRKPAVKIREGQLLVKFDLTPALEDVAVLEAQINYVESRLRKQLQKLTKAKATIKADNNASLAKLGKSSPNGRGTVPKSYAVRGNAEDWLRSLRTLDAKAAGLSQARIFEMLYPERIKNRDGVPRRALPAELKSLARKAHDLAEQRYIALALPRKTVSKKTK